MACVSGWQCLPAKYGGLRRGGKGRAGGSNDELNVRLIVYYYSYCTCIASILSDECDCIAPSKPVLPLLYLPTAKAKDGGECIHSTPIRYSPALSNINKRIRVSFFFFSFPPCDDYETSYHTYCQCAAVDKCCRHPAVFPLALSLSGMPWLNRVPVRGGQEGKEKKKVLTSDRRL